MRGSTVALTDETGIVTERFQYSPYGLFVGGDASTTPFLFNGKYGVMTDGNGLYYMRDRYHNPGSFCRSSDDVQTDTIPARDSIRNITTCLGLPRKSK